MPLMILFTAAKLYGSPTTSTAWAHSFTRSYWSPALLNPGGALNFAWNACWNGDATGSFCRIPTTVDHSTPSAALPASCRYCGIDGAYCWSTTDWAGDCRNCLMNA